MAAMGERAWSERAKAKRFGAMAVTASLHAGDGGTFVCHVQERVKKGTWSIHRLATATANAVIAQLEGAEPARFEDAGAIVIDSGVGAFLTGAAAKDLGNLDEDNEDFAMDVIDEALFAVHKKEAIVQTPKGHPLAVFQLAGDGEYGVAKGLDAKGKVCVLIVVQSEES